MDRNRQYSQVLQLDDDTIVQRRPEDRRTREETLKSAEKTRQKIRDAFSQSEKLKASLRP